MGLQIGPKSIQKMFKNHLVPTCPQETTPRGPKTAPRGPQTLPKKPQGRSKRPLRPSQEALRETQSLPRPPKRPQLDLEGLPGRISPPSDLLSNYAQSHSIHHTFICWKFSRHHQKDPRTFQDEHIGASELPNIPASEPPSACRQAPRRDSRSANNLLQAVSDPLLCE